jgi:hypothetical protein
MTRPVQVRNDDVAREIRELAELMGRPITTALGAVVHNELVRLKQRMGSAEERSRRIDAILARIDRLPRTGETLTDDDLYDEDGLPR